MNCCSNSYWLGRFVTCLDTLFEDGQEIPMREHGSNFPYWPIDQEPARMLQRAWLEYQQALSEHDPELVT